jgi:hypothetical protein
MNNVLKLILGLAALAGVSALLVWAFLEGRAEMDREREREQPVSAPQRIFQEAGGDVVLKLDKATQDKIGLKAEPLAHTQMHPEAVAYGKLEVDPSRVFTLRAPFAGRLIGAADAPWPNLGATITQGAAIGEVTVRIAPTDRVGLQGQLATARGDVEDITASLAASRASFDRARKLNTEDGSVPEKTVQSAEAKVKGEEAQLKAATEKVRQLEAVLSGSGGTSAGRSAPLSAIQGGEAIEVLAQPGELVESGQPILRIARFDHVLARVDLPAGEHAVDLGAAGRIAVLGYDDQFVAAEPVALGASSSSATQGREIVFGVAESGFPLRPGMAVSAFLPRTGDPLSGVTISRSAVVRHDGKAWAYVQLDGERFKRQEIELDYPTRDGWFMSQGLKAGDRLVSVGAQALLSEEFKFQIHVGEEAEGK